jgi:two-component system sensor histidine kinase FlrB
MKARTGNEAGDLRSPEALQMAFEAFNELSSELNATYHALQERVEQLTREVEQANQRRLEELAEKERLASRLQNLLQLLPGGVVVLDARGRVGECNAAALELLGAPLEGADWRDVIRNRFAPREDDGHEISMRDGRRVSLLTRSLDDEPGQIILITDQTETRRLQQHLSRHQRLSEMGRMVSSLAHQIRTPLSAAMLYAGHLDGMQLPPDQQQRTVGKLNARLHNMERQVSDMLLFARGDAVLDADVPAGMLLTETRMAAETLLRSGGQHVVWDNSAGNAVLRCNRDALIGAVLNLVENALQAAGSHALLFVRLVVEPEGDADHVLITVRDNGPGIAPDEAERAREAFYTTRPQGTGLGLAVAQVVARAHQGVFFIRGAETSDWPETEKSRGTVAGFRLPVRGCAATEDRTESTTARINSTEGYLS